MRILFRCDASLDIGTGHVMRCLTLAEAMRERGASCVFACRMHPGNLAGMLRERGFVVRELEFVDSGNVAAAASESSPGSQHQAWLGADWQTDARQVLAIIDGGPVDWLIVDHYALDHGWERAVRPACRRLMVIDDLADRRHDCDLLLDQNFGREAGDYAQLVPKHCKVLAGSRFVLLRPEFAALRPYSLGRRALGPPRHLLVAMGGVDQSNATGEVLQALKRAGLPGDCRISIVLGPHAPWLAEVRALAEQMPWPTSVHVGITDISRLMAESDVAIGSGGGGTYERIFMGLPALLRPIAANQVQPLRTMADAGLFGFFEGPTDLLEKLETAVKCGVTPPPDVVADGTDAVCHELCQYRVALVRPRPLDVRRTFHWLQSPTLRKDFLTREAPVRKTHFGYWRKLLGATDQYPFSVLFDDVHVGNAGIKQVDRQRSEAELWLYLGDAEMRGKGLGAEILAALEAFIKNRLELEVAVLHVSKANAAAVGLYSKAGYLPVPDHGSASPAFDGESVMKLEKRL